MLQVPAAYLQQHVCALSSGFVMGAFYLMEPELERKRLEAAAYALHRHIIIIFYYTRCANLLASRARLVSMLVANDWIRGRHQHAFDSLLFGGRRHNNLN